MLGRRDFLKTSTLVGVSAGAAGCAGRNEGLLVVPSETLSVQNMEAYLTQLDSSMHLISTGESPYPKVFPGKNFDKSDPVIKNGEDLLRKNLRSLMLVGSFHDLPEEGRVYPGMQKRIWGSMNEMDESMLGMYKAVKELTPTERVEIGRALRADPELGMKVIGALDEQAAQFGFSMERRTHLRSLAIQACGRIKQSSSMFIDEYVAKTEKIMARPLDPEEIQHRLLATMGETEFFALRDRHERYIERWQVAQSTNDSPLASQQKRKVERANTLLTVGGILLGLGIIVLAVGAFAITFTSLEGLFVATAGALLSVGGIVLLIVGAVLRARAT
jgi:hypothetical protein